MTEVRSFLGLANQLGSFVPDLAHMSTVLRGLLKKDVSFVWLQEHEEAFTKMREILCSKMVVKSFDPQMETYIMTDASRLYGMGYALIQKEAGSEKLRLVQCGSRSLNETEKQYATIELECLAVQWAVKHCRYYLFGKENFIVVTDHRPLLGIFKKPLNKVPNERLRRLREKLSQYSFVMEWREGKTHYIADALSRAPVFKADESYVFKLTMGRSLHMPEIFKEIEDKSYKELIEALEAGKNVNNLPLEHVGRRYKPMWSELSVEKFEEIKLVMWNDRIVVPTDLREVILEKLHVAHCGITKTREAAKEIYYWPRMNEDIERFVGRCEKCIEMLPSKKEEEALDREEAVEPMSDLSLDLFEVKGRHYLVMVDRFSGFPWVKRMKTMTSIKVIKVLNRWFDDWGFPRTLLSDGGPQFRSQEFSNYCKGKSIKHTLSSPYNHRSNGLAEAAVKNMKYLILKVDDDGEKFSEALLEFRNMPKAGKSSPALMFYKRVPRGMLPKLVKFKESQRSENVDGEFAVGDKVLIQDPLTKQWKQKGRIIKLKGDKSYIILTDDDKEIWRNQKFLRKNKIGMPIKVGAKESVSDELTNTRRSERIKRKHFN